MWSHKVLNLVLGMCASREATEWKVLGGPSTGRSWEMEANDHLTFTTSSPRNITAATRPQTLSLLSKSLPEPCGFSIPIPISSFLPPLPSKVTLRAARWRVQALPTRKGGHWVGLESLRDTLPGGGSRCPGRGLWHPPPGWMCQKGVYSEPVEQTSWDDNQIIFENEMRRGVGTKACEKKNRWKLQKLVLCILRPSWFLAGFEISVDNSFTIGPQKKWMELGLRQDPFIFLGWNRRCDFKKANYTECV